MMEINFFNFFYLIAGISVLFKLILISSNIVQKDWAALKANLLILSIMLILIAIIIYYFKVYKFA
ncbi:hypothetical protein SMI01S_32060 [Sphingobacterium mizutaii NBRC 14946 = DSM 11724]|uniref:Uncharacterized protein n=2 Tax=Sphingobacterium mizutaii TaxID=1010 RepID=A0AAJ4XD07_9SPHI|nr:hypothetical protein [Sphingobacterium mizutaii]GEM69600.1 hypothetical protein SMI01S_32060 [Sphingobacterium mizutaii NBRC 14946 = DSM 11724]SDL26077.1 hypothetical protein SAMN05192578_102135 [Sphingobacterium mizutaii]SNV53322.1 Uncharacterised protein [Sphingobacterium mizutaii]